MKKQPEATAKTKQSFIDAFCELYSQKAIEKISIQEISRVTGYNRSTFYQYFTDIYDLQDYLENDVLDYMKKISESEPCVTSPSDVHNIVDLFEEKGSYLDALLGDYGNLSFLERLKNEILSDELDAGMEDDNPMLPYIREFKITTSTSLFRLWQRRKKDLSSEELIELIQTLYSSAIAPYLIK